MDSKKALKEVKLKIEKIINPKAMFEKPVVKSGEGAVVYAEKKYIGKKALVIILGDEKNERSKKVH